MVIGDESFKIAWHTQIAWSNRSTGDYKQNNIETYFMLDKLKVVRSIIIINHELSTYEV